MNGARATFPHKIDELKGVPLDSVPVSCGAYKEKKTLVIKGLDGLCESKPRY